jgi:phosphoribosylanthranilate isomerase
MTWVKICGITNLEDAMTAVDAGADALGFVFYEKSPRYVSPQAARAIIEKLPQGIEKVGVFVNTSAEQVSVAVKASATTAIQVYVDVVSTEGKSDCPYCFEQLVRRKPPIKLIPVLSMQSERPEGPAMMWNPDAVHAFLLDSGSGGQPGGTGRQFDWAANEAATKVIKSLANVVVAGGLTPTNVAEAMCILKPWGVDVASGVEARPGKKDPHKVREFIRAVRETDKEV